jgi:hypothetical protein
MASLAKRGLEVANSARVSDRGRKRVIMVKKSVNYSEPIIFAIILAQNICKYL